MAAYSLRTLHTTRPHTYTHALVPSSTHSTVCSAVYSRRAVRFGRYIPHRQLIHCLFVWHSLLVYMVSVFNSTNALQRLLPSLAPPPIHTPPYHTPPTCHVHGRTGHAICLPVSPPPPHTHTPPHATPRHAPAPTAQCGTTLFVLPALLFGLLPPPYPHHHTATVQHPMVVDSGHSPVLTTSRATHRWDRTLKPLLFQCTLRAYNIPCLYLHTSLLHCAALAGTFPLPRLPHLPTPPTLWLSHTWWTMPFAMTLATLPLPHWTPPWGAWTTFLSHGGTYLLQFHFLRLVCCALPSHGHCVV